MDMLFAGQGWPGFGDFDGTLYSLKNERKVSCALSSLTLSMERETAEIKESCSGSRLTLAEYEKSKSLTVRLEMQQFDEEMLALALYGQVVDVTGSTVTGETLPTMVAGGYYHTRHPKISTVVVKDSAVTPATLVEGTDYLVDSADFGRIRIIDIGAYTQPFKVDYAYAARKGIKPFTQSFVVKGLSFDGTSTVDGSKVRVVLPRISLSPTSEFGLIGEDPSTLTLEGKVLLADVPTNDPVLGPFGGIMVL